jgi:hypothetical protein
MNETESEDIKIVEATKEILEQNCGSPFMLFQRNNEATGIRTVYYKETEDMVAIMANLLEYDKLFCAILQSAQLLILNKNMNQNKDEEDFD